MAHAYTSEHSPSPWARRYVAFLQRWNVLVLVLTGALAALGFYGSARLYMDLRTDLEELLPESAQSVKDVRRVVSRVGGFNHLSIVLESPSAEANARLQHDLTTELRKLPPSLVARVEDNVVRERDFFLGHKHLYMDLEDWAALDEYVGDRIEFEKAKFKKRQSRREASVRARKLALNSKATPFSSGIAKEPQYDFKALEEKYRVRASTSDRLPNGYFRSANGYTAVVLAFLPGKVTDQNANQKLFEAAKAVVASLNPQRYDRAMRVGFNGDVSNLIEEHDGLIEDLELSTILVLALVALAMLLYYRTFAGVYALCAALFAGTFWTFGLSEWIVGYLNANTAFLGSIVIGNGINFGIILLARYLERRRKGDAAAPAMEVAMTGTIQATFVAAGAAGLAYASLMVTDFRGFNQFGIIGGLGMACCWISTFTVMPALLFFFERRGWIRVKPTRSSRDFVTAALARFVRRFHKPLTAATAASIVVAAAMCLRLGPDTLESDFSKLRNKHSVEQGSGYWGRKVDAVFQRYLTPTVVVTDSVAELQAVARQLKKIKEEEGALSPISDVKVIEDFLPTDQAQKIAHIRHIQKMLTPEVLAHVRGRERRRMDVILPPADEPLRPLTVTDLPDGVKVHFRELDGTEGRMVHVYPRLAMDGSWDGREVIHFADQVRQAIRDSAVPVEHAPIAGQPPLSADMIYTIARDGPKATAVAFVAVALLVLLVFRSLRMAGPILGALVLGVLWMAGIMAAYDMKVNFLNFIALPITFGIGVDYAVNVISRYSQDAASIDDAIRETGGAVALCSLTTVIGYGSLLVAGSQAFVSFGLLAVLGELTCIVAALVALPAFMVYREERQARNRPKSSLRSPQSTADASGASL